MTSEHPRVRELKFTLHRIFRNPSAIIGFTLLFVFTAVAIFAPQIAPPKYAHNPYLMPHKGFSPTPQPPGPEHIFGSTSGQYDIFYGYIPIFSPGVISDQFTLFILDHPDKFTRYTGMYTLDGILNGRLDVTLDAMRHLVLPVTTYVIVVVALNMRVMRSGIIEELSKDYVMTARAKGADPKTVHIKHARKNAMLPVITVAGQLVALSMEGSISVEVVFNRQGIGWWLAHSAVQLDMPVLMCICLFMGIVFVITNLALDILYAYIDPRIRLN